MKKRSKRILLLIMVFTLMLTTLPANAVSREARYDSIEYSSEDIPKEKLEQIFKAMNGISDSSEENPRSILCIFGHSKATGTIRTIEHRYWATAPRCRETISAFEYCTRNSCDYFIITRQNNCCSLRL